MIEKATVNQRFIHTGARKLRLIADVIRGKSIESAQKTLTVLPQRGAKTMAEIVKSAESAAKSQNIDGPLVIASVQVDEGPAMKRRVLAGRGRATRFEHRMSHVTLTVNSATPKPAPAKKEKKA